MSSKDCVCEIIGMNADLNPHGNVDLMEITVKPKRKTLGDCSGTDRVFKTVVRTSREDKGRLGKHSCRVGLRVTGFYQGISTFYPE